jgi:hypothetical protein
MSGSCWGLEIMLEYSDDTCTQGPPSLERVATWWIGNSSIPFLFPRQREANQHFMREIGARKALAFSFLFQISLSSITRCYRHCLWPFLVGKEIGGKMSGQH